MTASPQPSAVYLGLVALLALFLTRLMIEVGNRRGWLAAPRADRWHVQPTALYGGVAIFGTSAVAAITLAIITGFRLRLDLLGLCVGGVMVFLVGLADDLRRLRPLPKLVGQIAATVPFLAGVWLVYGSHRTALNTPLMLVWIVLLTNSFNLLDNMDGLSAGTAVIVGAVISGFAARHGLGGVSLAAASVASAALGFLGFNLRVRGPARIFMGDCGSMFLGYVLAGLSILGVSRSGGDMLADLALPLLIMAVPIFDTTLVIILRLREGRAVMQGGKDHASHRLVYSGLSSRTAVVALYGISVLGACLAIWLSSLQHPAVMMIVTVLASASGLYALGSHLSRFPDPDTAVSGPALEPSLEAHPS